MWRKLYSVACRTYSRPLSITIRNLEALLLLATQKQPLENMEAAVEHQNDELMLQSMFHLDELLKEESLPPFPFLHQEFSDIASMEEIRRTLVVVNIDESVSGQELLEFFGNAGDVKYTRFCLRRNDPIRYCLVEFSSLFSIISGLKMNNQTIHGRIIKVYHSTEAIEKPSYLRDPESFKHYLWELKCHVEDSVAVVEKAAKAVSEYEDYCTDNQAPSKSPLKNIDTAIAELEEALSKVLAAQSLISVAVCPVEPQLHSILGEALGEKESIPSSPESFLKYISQKSFTFDEEDLNKYSKKEQSKSKKTVEKDLRKRHRTRSTSRERTNRYHSRPAGGGTGKSYHHHHHHHEDRSRSHDRRSSGHDRHSSSQLSSVSSTPNDHTLYVNSNSSAYKSNEKDQLSKNADDEAKEVNHNDRVIAMKSIQKDPENESEKENGDQGSEEVVSNPTLQTCRVTSEKNENPCGKDMKDDSLSKTKHWSPSADRHSHHVRRSRSRTGSGKRRSSSQREHHKSPDSFSRRRSSPSSCEKERRGRLHKRRSKSPSLDHYHRHCHHTRSRSKRSGSGDRSRRLGSLSSRRERWKGDESREEVFWSSRQATKGQHSPRRRKWGHGGEGQERATAGRPVVTVRPEAYEDYLEAVDVGGGEEAQSLQLEDENKTEVASCSGSQNRSTNGREMRCEDKEGGGCQNECSF